MICQTCHKHEPKHLCGECGEPKRFVTEASSGNCPDCIKKAARAIEVKCRKCGRTRRPRKPGGEYCTPCQARVNCGRGKCSGCGKNRQYVVKRERLCSACFNNRSVPQRLPKLLKRVRIYDQYNQTLFRHFASLIDCEKANGQTWSRVTDFVRFLNTYHFSNPIKWESIIQLKSELAGPRFHYVRQCLQQLGDLLLDPSKDETLEECKIRIKPIVPLASLEPEATAFLARYDLWLRTERQNTTITRQNHLQKLAEFWRWCVTLELTTLAAVERAHVEEFLHKIGLKWKCRHCSLTKNITRRGESPPAKCENLNCLAVHSYEKVVRCKPRTVEGFRATFRVFFRWLKNIDEGTKTDPVPKVRRRKWNGKTRGLRKKKYPQTIQYYDWEVIDALLKAIEDATTPAEEAMALYLLLHHGFYPRELRTVRIPAQCLPPRPGMKSSELLEDVLSLEWLPRKLSRGRQFQGRTGAILKMEPADEPWLRDLIKRFMKDRDEKQQHPNNPYLFVGTSRTPRRGPVAGQYFSALIARATARVTGRVCRVDILGKSSRVLYSEFGGHEGFRHLREFGLSEDHARSYAWAQRVRVVPKKASQIVRRNSYRNLSVLEVPATDIFGNPTDN